MQVIFLTVNQVPAFAVAVLQVSGTKYQSTRELIAMKRLWSITRRQIELERRIDGESPESYGFVYRVTSRNPSSCKDTET